MHRCRRLVSIVAFQPSTFLLNPNLSHLHDPCLSVVREFSPEQASFHPWASLSLAFKDLHYPESEGFNLKPRSNDAMLQPRFNVTRPEVIGGCSVPCAAKLRWISVAKSKDTLPSSSCFFRNLLLDFLNSVASKVKVALILVCLQLLAPVASYEPSLVNWPLISFPNQGIPLQFPASQIHFKTSVMLLPPTPSDLLLSRSPSTLSLKTV